MHTIYVFICVLLVGIVFGIIGTVITAHLLAIREEKELAKDYISRVAFRILASNDHLTWAEALDRATNDLYQN